MQCIIMIYSSLDAYIPNIENKKLWNILFSLFSRPILSCLLFQADYLNFKLLSFSQQKLDCTSFRFWVDKNKSYAKKPLWFCMSEIGIGLGESVMSVNIPT